MADAEPYHAVLKASYDYSPQSDDDIALTADQLLFLIEKVDDEWWKVKVKTDSQDTDSPIGLVPAAYVEQAHHNSVVKVVYDYEASAPGELTVHEDEILLVFETEEDWILVQSQKADGGAGYIPGTYVEAASFDDNEPLAPNRIVVPDSPPRPVNTYVDPADRVASTKVAADDIKTWPVSEIDKKGKKKKGTLGVGNGAVFFASEADKTPVQKWRTLAIHSVSLEKSKHIHIELSDPYPITLHFHAGSKDNADEIVLKLKSSKALSEPLREGQSSLDVSPLDTISKESKKASVHFSPASPVIIPDRTSEDEAQEEEEQRVVSDVADAAVALYDFAADGEDELSVAEGEEVVVLERDSDEWWKCRNSKGLEGVVPASYLESSSISTSPPARIRPSKQNEDDELESTRAVVAAEREEAERRQREEDERAAKAREKMEAQERAQEAATAAEAEWKRRKEQTAAHATSAPQKARSTPQPVDSKKAKEEPVAAKSSLDGTRPPPEKTRVWHDRSGQFRVEAAFLGFSNGKLRLHKVNGVIVEVPSEKMSLEDMRFVEKFLNKRQKGSGISDDDIPLAISHKRESTPPTRNQPSRKAPKIDWFDFFLSAGCDLDDCTRYAASFERDKIDENLLPDITDATMRSLGLREGDIIRVTKAIEKRKPADNLIKASASIQGQLRRDEELAKQLQAQENGAPPRASAPNLFAGPGGVLKNPRRGRPQPSKSLPLSNVDLEGLTTASDQMQRTNSPQAISPAHNRPPSVSAQPSRSSSALATPGGFDDDAWTNRPSSTKPLVGTPPPTTPQVPSVPPMSGPSTLPKPTPTTTAPPPQETHPVSTPATLTQKASLAQTTEDDIFQQLARVAELRRTTPSQPPPSATPPINALPTTSYSAGLGMGTSPTPLGQLQSQPTYSPQPYNGPRGPFAPVPANQSLLQPLIPTQTGFASFVPTRPSNSAPPFQNAMSPSAYLPPQQAATVLPTSQPIPFQPTGMGFGGFGTVSPFQNTSGFGQVQTHSTGYNPSAISPFSNGVSVPPPVPPLPSSVSNNTSPANVFAQMKSGTFAADAESSAPRPSDMYNALRPNAMAGQAAWGQVYPSYTGYQH